jgi:antirestriction protein ArdC
MTRRAYQSDGPKLDAYEVITESIVERLEAGTAPWRQSWAAGGQPRNIEGHAYRGINVFQLLARGYSSPYWLTFNQARERGGMVRKGEKSTRVIFWKMLKYGDESEDTDGEEDSRRTVRLLRYYSVFNLDQTDGVKLPARVIREVAEAEARRAECVPVEAAEAILTGQANPPRYREDQSACYYMPSADLVGMPPRETFDSVESFYAASFHETGHATGHVSRLGRAGVMERHAFGDADYSQEELVAEMTAAFLCGESGILPATIDNAASYLAGWIRALRGDKKLVIVAAAQAQKAADYIMGRSAQDAAPSAALAAA